MPATRREGEVRLLLLEFFPTVLRRNETAMLFPFIKGQAQAGGARTLWLCFGGTHEPDSSQADRRVLALHLNAFGPTHVIASQGLSPNLKAALTAQRPRPAFTQMPSPTAPDCGDPAVVCGRDGGERFFSRCGWLRLWTGQGKPADDASFLVEKAEPDYGALLVNQEAWASQAQITLTGGMLCGNGRDARANPALKDALPARGRFPGCTFCGSGRAPLSAPAGDPIALAEKQFSAIRATGGAGRDKRVYELYDIRSFWKFDELFDAVLRQELPPSVFLFNPRVDDVVRVAERIERALPGLAKAGHEARIMSMGVENFSPPENERFNKGILASDVEDLLKLSARWERAWPGTFKPFKAGHDKVELGFILFTPWTTPADLRFNLDCAKRLGFAEEGYWLFSTLQVREEQPLWHLAKKEGGIIAEEFADRGQAYGCSLNGGDVKKLVPWRFKDQRTAEYFNLLVRVCAAKREGASCRFFKDDPLFAATLEALGGRPQEVSPFAFARRMLDALESGASGSDLLARALPRARPAPAAAPAAGAVSKVFSRLAQARPAALSGLELKSVAPREGLAAPGTSLVLSISGREVELELFDASTEGPCMLRSKRFRVVCARRTPVRSQQDQRQIALLLGLLDAAVEEPKKA